MITYNDQRDHDDGVTVENTELPNIIGWGETPSAALADLQDQTSAVFEVMSSLIQELDQYD
jgi:predicted RNase H-like HicB family nuclease